ncbi:MAG: long-chain fatty acid--CoA ligase [Bacteroidales bacterium]|nr:long-chain fatty acid--CoA ligase [Bacteroidales bacterium]
MEVTRIFDLLDNGLQIYREWPALASKRNGVWVEYSMAQYAENATNLSYALMDMGLSPGDKVGSVASNRPEWNMVDMGVAQAGLVHVPIYPTIGIDEYRHILSHAEIRVLFVGDRGLYTKLLPIVQEMPQIMGMYVLNDEPELPCWQQVLGRGGAAAPRLADELQRVKAAVKPDDVVSMVYTSGTTGTSKGVMLTHANFLSNVYGCMRVIELRPKEKAVSFLPLSHVFERMVNYCMQLYGMSIYYSDLASLPATLRELKPYIFITVPRMLEKFYDKIIATGKDLSGIKKQIFFWAANLAYRYNERHNSWFYTLKLRVARKLVLDKWNAAFGGQLRYVISGSAALQPKINRAFLAAGVPLIEGYGLTETSPVISVNHPATPGNIKVGSVGPLLHHTQVKIAADGEILMKGPGLMKGYYKAPELTAQAIDAEGWFHTGDIGFMDEGKFLTITDRKKEIFKLSSGKYIAPQIIENKLKGSFFIEQCMVVGENEKFASTIISPNFSFLHDWCARHKVHFQNNQELITLPEVVARYQREVNSLNKELSDYEQIKRFRLVADQWSPTTGELSPTLKLKRKVIYERYEPLLIDIYKHEKIIDVRGVRE